MHKNVKFIFAFKQYSRKEIDNAISSYTIYNLMQYNLRITFTWKINKGPVNEM